MVIELVIDKYCVSLDTFEKMRNRVEDQFSTVEVLITPFDENPYRMKQLGVNILPAWVVNNEVIRINPLDYESLQQQLHLIILAGLCAKC